MDSWTDRKRAIMPVGSSLIHRVSKKTLQLICCQNFVKFRPIVKIFGTKIANRTGFPRVYSVSTSPAAYLVDDCQLVSHAGRRRLRSADIDTFCSTDQHSVRRPELCSRWNAALEQSAGQDSPARQ